MHPHPNSALIHSRGHQQRLAPRYRPTRNHLQTMKYSPGKLLPLLLLLSLTAAGSALLWPGSPAPAELYKTGKAAALNADWKTASAVADQLQKLPEWEAHAGLLRGFIARGRGQLKEALLLFSLANSNPATRTEAYFHAGSILHQQQQFKQSILLLRQVLDWQPDHLDALRLLAASWYDIGAMEKAIQTLREVARLAPADYRPVYMQASILQDFERWEDASLAFAEAAAKAPAGSPVSAEIHAAWGDCLTQLRRWEQALSVLENAGDWPTVLALKAQAMYSLRRFDEAARLAQLALAKDPTQPDATLVAAATLERQNNATQGLQILSNCLQKHPYDLRLHHRTADLLAALERPADAEHYRRQAGEIAALRNRFSTAQQTLVQDTTTVEKRLEVAALAEQLGELQTAERWLRAAVGMAPELPAANAALEHFLQKHPPATTNNTPPTNTVTNPPVTMNPEF